MFSKKMVLIVGVIVLIAVNIIFLSVNSRRYATFGLERVAISFISPFQELVTRSIRFTTKKTPCGRKPSWPPPACAIYLIYKKTLPNWS